MEYYASPNFGGIFLGIGVFLVLVVIAYMLYQFARNLKFSTDKEAKYSLLEEIGLEKVATKKGIDLCKEAVKREVIQKKNFRKRVEDEIYDELFKDGENKIRK